MYNRYVGNTGKYYRVSEPDDHAYSEPAARNHDNDYDYDARKASSEPEYRKRREERQDARGERRDRYDGDRYGGARKDRDDPVHGNKKKSSFFNLGSLKGFFESFQLFGLEAGDLILLLLFLFLFIESGDEEFLIILAVLAFSFLRDRNKSKDEEPFTR